MARVLVYVEVGEWRQDSVTLEWEFIRREGYPVKQVDISVVRCYRDLVSLFADSFDINEMDKCIYLSYWTPDEAIIMTNSPGDHLRIPPVELSGDAALATFLVLLARVPDTNLYMTLRDKPAGNDRAAGVAVIDNSTDGLSLGQDTPITESMLELIDRVEARHMSSRGRKSNFGDGPSCDGVYDGGFPRDTVGGVLSGSSGIADARGSLCTPLTVSRTLIFSPGSVGSGNMTDTPTIPGRGLPTLDDVSPYTVAGTSNWYRLVNPSAVHTPMTPFDEDRRRKGKGIYVPTQTGSESVGALPCFDLGIDGSTPSGVNAINGDVHDAPWVGSVDITDIQAALLVDPPAQMTYLPNADEHGLVHVGSVFPHKKDFHMALSLLALEQYFCFKIGHSDKSRVYARCIDSECGWRVSAKCFMDSDNVEITKYVRQHTCGAKARARYVEKATARVLAQLLNTKFGNGKCGPRACEIPEVVLSEVKVPITYMKAWYAKELAVATARGREDENFKLLTRYLRLLSASNPGSLTDVYATVDGSGIKQFKFLFVSLAASMGGWPHVRKVIGIDGTHLKGKYKGCLVAACCQDGNFQILPLAFGVVDSENIDSWVWFLENLSQIVTDDSDVVFISDRHPSIIAALRQVYPLSAHVCCIVHLYRNVKQQFKCGGLANMVSRCARAYTMSDFRYWWTQIENLSPECVNYLLTAGVSTWARSHCKGMRYNLMSSNICESFNNAIGKSVEYPIITMVEYVRTLMMKWFKDRRDAAGQCRTKCTPNVEKLLVENLKVASDMKTLAADGFIFQINDTKGWSFTVDLKTSTCTCNAFQSLKIPCSHALAAICATKDDIYSFVSPYYARDTWGEVYAGVIMPVPNAEEKGLDDIIEEDEELLPPTTRRPSGRPPCEE